MSIGASWGAWDTDGNATNPGDRISYPDWWGSNYGYGLSLMGPSEVIAAESAPTTSGVTHDFYLNAITGDFPSNGTSAAAPNVAGVASLVWSANPDLSASQVNGILHETAYDLGFQGYDYEYGSGFVNADAAVRRAMAIAGTPLYGQSAPAVGFMTALSGAWIMQRETMTATNQTGFANGSEGSNFQAAIANGVAPMALGQGRDFLDLFGHMDSTATTDWDETGNQTAEQRSIPALSPDSIAQTDWAAALSTFSTTDVSEWLEDSLLESHYALPWQIDTLTGESLIAT